jgi:uncharacterized protein (TIGR02246 family)
VIAQDRKPQLNTRADQPFRFLGVPTTVRATRETTGGAFGLVESSAMPPGFGSPYHVHHREDESFYVIEGEIAFVVDGQWHYAGAGTFVHGPRDIPHGFAVIGSRPARMLLLATPGGFEQFVLALRTPLEAAPEPPDMAVLMAAAARQEIEILGPLPDVPDDMRAGRDEARAALDRLRAAHVAALNANDAAGWTAIFAEDAVQLPPIGAINTGIAAIGAFNAGFLGMFAVSGFAIDPIGLEVHGDVAIEHGEFRIVVTPHGAPQGMSDAGKYITTYRRSDAGTWLIARDGWTSSLQPPADA